MSLLERVLERPELADLDEAQRRLALRDLARSEVSDADIAAAVARAAAEIDGYGPLTGLMQDESVTDILVNGAGDVWVERAGKLSRSGVRFDGRDHLQRFLERVMGDAGVAVDTLHPVADATLVNGARMHVALPPVAPEGPIVSVRKFPREPWSLVTLVENGMMTPAEAADLARRVRDRETLLIAGPTGSGKTSLLGALLGEIAPGERVVTIEETRELRPSSAAHVVALVTREANAEGIGGVDASMLVRAALRMRPDRIVVGEVRGPEAASALEALSTGHAGSLLTIHARSCRGARDRLASLVLLAGSQTEASVRNRIDAAIDAVVLLGRRAGIRRVEAIEVST